MIYEIIIKIIDNIIRITLKKINYITMKLNKQQLSAFAFIKKQIGMDSQIDWLLEEVYLEWVKEWMAIALNTVEETFNKIN